MSKTDQREQFAIEYAKCLTISGASRAVGINVSTGHQWIKEPAVTEMIVAEIESRKQRTRVDADWLLTQLADTFEADIADILDIDGTLKPADEWPAVWRKMVSGIDIREEFNREGEHTGRVSKVKMVDKLKVLETIGRHTDVKAFLDRVEVNDKRNLADKIRDARRRS